MPPLEKKEKIISSFEFWPTWLVYLPVLFQWIGLSIRHRSFSLPLIANPEIPLSGMVGFSKSGVLASAGEAGKTAILPFITHRIEGGKTEQLESIRKRLAQNGLELPLVGKPDLGCRGAGVQLLQTEAELETYLSSYPDGAEFMLQKLSNWEPEAGIFYVRHPDRPSGEIISLALKYSPYLVGDGKSTVLQLLEKDERAGQLKHLYEERHRSELETILPEGEPYRLVFSASHCRGAVFRNGNEYITDALTRRLDEILGSLPDFHYGRLDVKFKDTENLKRGDTLEIVEINGASSESLHIWDSGANLSEAWKALLHQYATLFRIGAENRRRGHRPPGLMPLWHAWQHERKLVEAYPETD